MSNLKEFGFFEGQQVGLSDGMAENSLYKLKYATEELNLNIKTVIRAGQHINSSIG